MSNAGEAKTRRVRRVAMAGRPTLDRSHGVANKEAGMSNAGEAKTRRVRRVAMAGRPTLDRPHGVANKEADSCSAKA